MTENCHLINGQKQRSEGWNLGAVANAFAASLLLYTVIMLEKKEANTFSL